MKVLVVEPISDEGLAILREEAQVDVKLGLKQAEVNAIVGDYDAIIVRSQIKVDAEMIRAGKKLQVIARAGVGVDNVDVTEATKAGIIVVNAPTGNTVSAAEHTIGLMLALARNIPQANASLQAGQWRRNEFMGVEVRGKTLGIIGLGRVGSEVARRALSMEMRLIGFDPFVSPEYARNMQIETVSFEELLKRSDFITIHTPLTDSTKGLIGPEQLALVKPTVRIINVARGGLVEEKPLVDAIKAKKVAGAAIDVFPVEPVTDSVLFGQPHIIVTPHLGASTTEAQLLAARDVAEQIVSIFKGQAPIHSVNVPYISPEVLPVMAPFMKVAHALGKLLAQLAEGQVKSMQVKYDGEISCMETNVLKASILGGLLEEISEERVNVVNANIIAGKRGLKVSEQTSPTCEFYSSMVSIEATTSKGTVSAAGTVIRGETHIVLVNGYSTDIVPTGGYFIFSDHMDRPGLLGAVGGVTGEAGVNISAMHVSRLKPRGVALMILALDEKLDDAHIKRLKAIPDVYTAKMVKL